MESRPNRLLANLTGSRLLPFLAGLLFLASFYYQMNMGGTAAFMPYTWTTWSVAVVVIAIGILLLCFSEKIVLPRYWTGLVALPTGLLIAGLVMEITRPIDWALRIGTVIGGFLFLFALFQYRPGRRSIETVLYLLALAGLGHALAALLHLYGGTWWHGWIPKISGEARGIFQQVNLVASFSATALVTAAYLVTVPGYTSRSVLYKTTIHAIVILCAAIILATGSRAGLFGLVVGLFVLVMGRYRILLRKKSSFVMLSAALLVGLGYGIHLSDLTKMQGKLERSGYEEIRVAVYEISWDLFKEKPLFGHGLGRFQKVFQEGLIPFQEKHPDAIKSTTLFSHPHNEFLFWLVEGGLVAVLGMLVAIAVSIRQLVRLGRERGLAYLGMIIPISLHVMVELPFYLSAIHWFTWLILFYLMHSHADVTYQNKMSPFARKSLPTLSAIFAVLLILFFLSTLQSLKGFREFDMTGNLNKIAKVASNPILNERATGVMLTALLNQDIATGKRGNTARYIEWAESYVADVPHQEIMATLALAYSHLGDVQNARRVIDRALAIYSSNRYLQECKRQMDAGTFVEFYKKQKLTRRNTKPAENPGSQ